MFLLLLMGDHCTELVQAPFAINSQRAKQAGCVCERQMKGSSDMREPLSFSFPTVGSSAGSQL